MRLASILAVVASMMALAPVTAQELSRDKEEQVQLQHSLCAALCARVWQECGEPSSPARCDTRYVECLASACQACVPAFQTCIAAPTATMMTCQTPFLGCFKPRLANMSTDRPLIRFEGGDGATADAAVVILGVQTDFEGIVAERLWALKTHPEWRKQEQTLLHQGDRDLDEISYDAPDGHHVAWFDITAFFGKM